jgi:putative addiction module component (TIGR02574 family)
MGMSSTAIDISRLSKEERLRLLEDLWDSFVQNPEDLPLTDAQRNELDRRIESMERDPSAAIPWEEVLRRIQAKQK